MHTLVTVYGISFQLGNRSPAYIAATSGSPHSVATVPMATDAFKFTTLFNCLRPPPLICNLGTRKRGCLKRKDVATKEMGKEREFLIIGINEICNKAENVCFQQKVVNEGRGGDFVIGTKTL